MNIFWMPFPTVSSFEAFAACTRPLVISFTVEASVYSSSRLATSMRRPSRSALSSVSRIFSICSTSLRIGTTMTVERMKAPRIPRPSAMAAMMRVSRTRSVVAVLTSDTISEVFTSRRTMPR